MCYYISSYVLLYSFRWKVVLVAANLLNLHARQQLDIYERSVDDGRDLEISLG